MRWRNKARLAKWISLLPPGPSLGVYYFIQRHFGALRSVNPVRCLKAGLRMVEFVEQQRGPLSGSETFLEVGTGRSLGLPIALWLCGASRVITVDLNDYLKAELVFEDLEYIRSHEESVREVFGDHAQNPAFVTRFPLLIRPRRDVQSLLDDLNCEYWAPADAAHLDLPSGSIDYHVSFMVDQHVRPEALLGILMEGKRLLRNQGLFLHYAVFSDLFSGVDNSISPVNFLRYSDQEWERMAGNRYMYHNRLRLDEMTALWQRAGMRILQLETAVSPESLRLLESGGLLLDPRFRDKSPATNATQNAWTVAAPF